MNLDAVHFDWFWRKFWHDSTEGRLRHSPGTRLKPGTRRSGLLDTAVCPTDGAQLNCVVVGQFSTTKRTPR
jgi:hypothetical protein